MPFLKMEEKQKDIFHISSEVILHFYFFKSNMWQRKISIFISILYLPKKKSFQIYFTDYPTIVL